MVRVEDGTGRVDELEGDRSSLGLVDSPLLRRARDFTEVLESGSRGLTTGDDAHIEGSVSVGPAIDDANDASVIYHFINHTWTNNSPDLGGLTLDQGSRGVDVTSGADYKQDQWFAVSCCTWHRVLLLQLSSPSRYRDYGNQLQVDSASLTRGSGSSGSDNLCKEHFDEDSFVGKTGKDREWSLRLVVS